MAQQQVLLKKNRKKKKKTKSEAFKNALGDREYLAFV